MEYIIVVVLFKVDLTHRVVFLFQKEARGSVTLKIVPSYRNPPAQCEVQQHFPTLCLVRLTTYSCISSMAMPHGGGPTNRPPTYVPSSGNAIMPHGGGATNRPPTYVPSSGNAIMPHGGGQQTGHLPMPLVVGTPSCHTGGGNKQATYLCP